MPRRPTRQIIHRLLRLRPPASRPRLNPQRSQWRVQFHRQHQTRAMSRAEVRRRHLRQLRPLQQLQPRVTLPNQPTQLPLLRRKRRAPPQTKIRPPLRTRNQPLLQKTVKQIRLRLQPSPRKSRNPSPNRRLLNRAPPLSQARPMTPSPSPKNIFTDAARRRTVIAECAC